MRADDAELARLLRRTQVALTEAEEQRRQACEATAMLRRVLAWVVVALTVSIVADVAEPLCVLWLLRG